MFKEKIEVKHHPLTYNYVACFKEPRSSTYVELPVSYDEAMLILGAIEQGREEAKAEIRKALGLT